MVFFHSSFPNCGGNIPPCDGSKLLSNKFKFSNKQKMLHYNKTVGNELSYKEKLSESDIKLFQDFYKKYEII